ncbi:protein N-lysine methyltransferase METTL21A-like [Antedon mediterranea]|uniref:protein N-lysine methyltransferase METTL21A-like n=1 Tax=Antedon mediterranea TaxID=105859 RepID=UPI003AF5615B
MALVLYKPPEFLEPFHKQERRFVFTGKEILINQDWEKLGVAAVVWDTAIVLSEYLERKVDAGELKLNAKRLLELGAGTGLAGMVAALLGAKATLTDRSEVIGSLIKNVTINFKDDQSNIVVKELEWGRNLDSFSETYDFIIGADIIYIKESFAVLLKTLTQLTHINTKVLLSCRIRYQKDLDFLEMLKDTFLVNEVYFDEAKGVHIYQATRLSVNT